MRGTLIGRALRRTAKRSRPLREFYLWSRGKPQQLYLSVSGLWSGAAGGRGRAEAPDPGGMIWIFGSGRSGSTWLRSMMGEMPGHRVWEEPMVGRLFGEFYERAPKENRRSADFIMGRPTRKGWLKSIRNFVLDGARYSNPLLRAGEYLVIKEPNGSVGAPLLLEALPESRVILLVRDPRDVVASVLDAARKGGWLRGVQDEDRTGQRALADRKPEVFVRRRAKTYLRGVRNARRAYDAHGGPKTLVRYEELRADTPGTMRRIYSELGVEVGEKDLRRAVEKHSWENVPEEEKGRGRFYRKASPGGWREDLTPEQARIVESVTAPLLRDLYP